MKLIDSKSLLILLFLTSILFSCSSDDNIVEQENKGLLTSVLFEANNNDLLEKDIEANIDYSKKEILVTLPFGVAVTDLIPTVISEGETTFEINTSFTKLLIKDSDGFLEETYTFKVQNGQNTESLLKSFVFETTDNPALKTKVVGTIDENAKTVTLTLAKGTDVTALTPTISLSENASITPEGKQDFSNQIEYKVTSEDGKSTNTYKIVINYINNTEATLEKFSFLASENSELNNDIEGKLYEFGQRNIIVANIDFNTNVRSLIPNISMSSGATINITGAQDFSKTVVYKITSQDGKKEKEYHVVTANPDKAALIAIYDANYTGLSDALALNWDITEPDLLKWDGIILNNEKRVSSLGFGISRVTKIPAEIGNLTELTTFSVSGNGPSELPNEFENLQKLRFLTLIGSTNMETLPKQVFNLPKLKLLHIGRGSIKEVQIPQDAKLKKLLLVIERNIVKLESISTDNLDFLSDLNLTGNKKEMLPDNICELKKEHSSLIKLDSDICR